LETMDRRIDTATRRRRMLRRLALPAGATVLALLLLFALAGWLRPSLSLDRIRTALVERGDVSATLDASGLVVPEFEQVLTAPIDTRVASIIKTAGAEVSAGEPIVLLDDRDARLQVEQLTEQISLRENQRRQTDLELARTRDDLNTRRDIKSLELRSYEYDVERNQELFELGLIARDMVRKARIDADRAVIELRHLEAMLANAEQDLAAKLEGLALEIAILEKDRDRARERLDRTVVASDRSGIVTWVVASEGTAVTEGEAVARVADLSAYRVDATLSDVLARRLVVGLPATVRSGDTRLPGRVRKILPTVENGIVTFEIALERDDHAILRPNLRVDVHAVTESRAGTLRLKRGPLLNIDGRDAVFVIRDGRAQRTKVEIGLANFEFYEITSGLVEGDEVVVSDMSDHRNDEEVMLR